MLARCARRASRVALTVLLTAVALTAQQTTRTYQRGGAGTAVDTLNRSCSVRETVSPTVAHVYEWHELIVGSAGPLLNGHALIDFPDIVGTGANLVPPGAQIVSAELELYCLSAAGSQTVPRNVELTLISDWPELRGSWFEPSTNSASPQLDQGVSWLGRDVRSNALDGGRAWDSNPTLGPTRVENPALLAQLPGLDQTIVVFPNLPGQNAVGEWHGFDVKTHVQLWAQGVANQGFLLSVPNPYWAVTYASDDHPTATLRPRLRVTWLPPSSAPLNRVPQVLAPQPAAPACSQGTSATMLLQAADANGVDPVWRVLKFPDHGTLQGDLPYVTYVPNPEFVGTDDFVVDVRDQLSTSSLRTISVQVTPDGQATTFQRGVTGSSGATELCHVRVSPWDASQSAFEMEWIRLVRGGRDGFLRFPNLFGGNAIPEGATILSARLEMTAKSVGNQGVPRTIIAERVIDPLDRGLQWPEPTTWENDPSGGLHKGVSTLYLDARPLALGQPGVSWVIPGGDVDPTDVASARLEEEGTAGTKIHFDVRSAIQAWSDGAPNMGWRLCNRNDDLVDFWSDDALTSSNRPKLVVSWLPPGVDASARPPIADAGPDQEVYSAQTVTLDARASRMPSGAPTTTYWLQIAGPPVSLQPTPSSTSTLPAFRQPTVRFTAPVANSSPVELHFVLLATGGGKFAFDNLMVTVHPQPGGGAVASPSVNGGPDLTVDELEFVSIDPAVSGGAGPYEILWTRLSGALPIDLQVAPDGTLTFQAPAVVGDRDIELMLEVRDLGVGFPSVVRDFVTVHVSDTSNTPPVADPGPNRIVDEGRWTVLDAGSSYDADGHPLTYTWTQLSGPAVALGQYRQQGTPEAVRTPVRMPMVASTQSIVFRLTVHDGEVSTNSNLVITVRNDLPAFAGDPNSLAPYRSELTRTEVRHLLRRAGYGWHPEDVAYILGLSRTPAIGLSGIVDGMTLEYDDDHPDVIAARDEAMNYAPIAATGVTPWINQAGDPYPVLTAGQVQSYNLVWSLRTPNPLVERTYRFWHDRLAASGFNLGNGKRWWTLQHGEMLRFGVRQPVWNTLAGIGPEDVPLVPGTGPLGDYREILLHFARDPLTLAFLDGFENVALAPNENFAREFFELHTLGLFDQNGEPIYSEEDVQEAARAFTGWQPSCTQPNTAHDPSCSAAFDPAFHDSGLKTVLGSTPTNFDDEAIVDLVLGYDGGVNASRWLARGLLEHFVTREPSEALVNDLGEVIREEQWQIKPVLRRLLKSQAMFAAAHRKSLVRSPVDFAMGIVSTLRIPIQTSDLVTDGLRTDLEALGHALGNPPDVTGFAKHLDWLDEHSMVLRGEMVRLLMNRGRQPTQPGTSGVPDYPGIAPTPVNLEAFMPPVGARFVDETVDYLLEALDVELRSQAAPGHPMSEQQIFREFLDSNPLYVNAGPFDGDSTDAEQLDRLRCAIMLLLEHPESLRF